MNGKWSQWEEWGGCSASCGNGVQIRKRFCNNPAPRNGGKTCLGLSNEAKYCSLKPCSGKIEYVWMCMFKSKQ